MDFFLPVWFHNYMLGRVYTREGAGTTVKNKKQAVVAAMSIKWKWVCIK